MNKSIFLIAAVAAVGLGLAGGDAPAQRGRERGPGIVRPFGQVGRYQMVQAADRWVFVIDTATGQCWSNSLDGQWHDAGNPARPTRRGERRPQRRAAQLELPENPVPVTAVQRRERAKERNASDARRSAE